jgi:hypothetical protein
MAPLMAAKIWGLMDGIVNLLMVPKSCQLSVPSSQRKTTGN